MLCLRVVTELVFVQFYGCGNFVSAHVSVDISTRTWVGWTSELVYSSSDARHRALTVQVSLCNSCEVSKGHRASCT